MLEFHNVAVGLVNKVAALTGFSYEKAYGRFDGNKNIGRNNEVAVKRGSTVLSFCEIFFSC